MKYLGMDLGTKTLGLAITDKLGTISSPYKVLRYETLEELIEKLSLIIVEQKIDELVLGITKNMNNSIGTRAEATLEFGKVVEDKFNIPIHLIDERLSTVEAEKYLIASDMRRKNRKQVIDSVAASIILQTYLERVNNGK